MSTENNINNELCDVSSTSSAKYAVHFAAEIVEEKPRRRRGPGKKEYKLTYDPKYYANYYMAKRSTKVHCENCARLVCRGKLYRHIQLPICARHSKDPEEVQKIKDEYLAKKAQA